MRTGFVSLALGLGAAALSGCGGGPAGGLVTGQVKHNGTPVADARVVFKPAGDGGNQYTALTDAAGQFDLSGGSSAWQVKPGAYKVQVYKLVPRKGAKLPPDADAEQLEASGMAAHALPKKYASPATTPLTATVTDGANMVALELEGK